MKHTKHTKMTRPDFGEFGRSETALVGAPCGLIQNFARRILEKFGEQYHIAYADADHAAFDNPVKTKFLAAGASAVYTDRNVYESYDFADKADKFERNRRFSAADLVLINGNHFAGKKQIVFIHPKKAASLERKREKLTETELIVFTEAETEIPTWLSADLGDRKVPTLHFDEVEKINAFFAKKLKNTVAPLRGLVLAGGKSVRMGTDKGAINYHGKPQREYVYEMLGRLGATPFLSGRKAQTEAWQADFSVLPDTFTGLGPFGAILSAFRENPNTAWLCVACDLPLLTEKALQHLIDRRDPSKIATAFHNPATDFPEPLITIWEPKSYPILLHFLSLGYSCPRKVLINSDVKIVQPLNKEVLKNVNTAAERDEVERDFRR